MSTWIRRGWAVAACVLAAWAVSKVTVAGQEAKAKDDILQALLVEVRGLRAAMEQMSAAGPRAQLVMGRLQLQEQRVNAAHRRLDDVRENIAAGERESAEVRERLTMMEDAVQRVADPSERESLAAQIKMTKTTLAQKGGDIQRFREQEAELIGVVATEEGRWTEISQRLDDLERALAPRR